MQEHSTTKSPFALQDIQECEFIENALKRQNCNNSTPIEIEKDASLNFLADSICSKSSDRCIGSVQVKFAFFWIYKEILYTQLYFREQ